MKSAFLDSSVLFTATNSPTGGSAKLFTSDKLKLVTSLIVLVEVERNVRKKLQDYHLERFFMLSGKLMILTQELNKKLVSQAKKIIVEKDAMILAEAKQAKCDFLITLDKKHFLTDKVALFLKPQKAVTPKVILGLLEREKGD